MILIKYKKADGKYLSPIWLGLLVVIAAAILIAFSIFNSGERDIREYETEFIFSKLVDCVSSKGYLSEGFLEGNFDLKECGFEETLLEEGSRYFFQLKAETLSEDNLAGYEFGNKAFDKECSVSQKVSFKESHECFYRSFVLLYFDKDFSSKKVTKLNFLIAID